MLLQSNFILIAILLFINLLGFEFDKNSFPLLWVFFIFRSLLMGILEPLNLELIKGNKIILVKLFTKKNIFKYFTFTRIMIPVFVTMVSLGLFNYIDFNIDPLMALVLFILGEFILEFILFDVLLSECITLVRSVVNLIKNSYVKPLQGRGLKAGTGASAAGGVTSGDGAGAGAGAGGVTPAPEDAFPRGSQGNPIITPQLHWPDSGKRITVEYKGCWFSIPNTIKEKQWGDFSLTDNELSKLTDGEKAYFPESGRDAYDLHKKIFGHSGRYYGDPRAEGPGTFYLQDIHRLQFITHYHATLKHWASKR